MDLGQVREAVERFEIWLAQVEPGGLDRVALINNAALLPTVVPLSELEGPELTQTIRVGLEAPMALTGAFLRVTEHWPCDRRVLNVSSGLGRRPMASQAAYCAVKAGMDHFTRCVALEEALRERGARVCSLAPGVIDTDMQVHLRESNPMTFPDLGSFKLLKEHGALSTPEQAAAKVLARLMRDDFGSEPVADVRHD
jgi:NAD(P)-dependent dehydrogenase (short-subunit alcohol dehydrogenase family)